jgi:hypothetical protein
VKKGVRMMRPYETMYWLNAVLVIIAGIVTAAAGAISLLVVTEAIAPADISPDGWFRGQLIALEGLAGSDEDVALGASAGAIAFGVFLLAMQLAPVFSREMYSGMDTQGHQMVINQRTIRHLIEHAAMGAEGVQKVDAGFRSRKGGLEVRCRVGLDSSANLAKAAHQLEERVTNELRETAGVHVASFRLRLDYADRARPGERAREREREQPTAHPM